MHARGECLGARLGPVYVHHYQMPSCMHCTLSGTVLKSMWLNPNTPCCMCSHMCSLQDNSIGDGGAISVAAGLRSNHSLRNLRQEPNFACVDLVYMVIREGGKGGLN